MLEPSVQGATCDRMDGVLLSPLRPEDEKPNGARKKLPPAAWHARARPPAAAPSPPRSGGDDVRAGQDGRAVEDVARLLAAEDQHQRDALARGEQVIGA